MSEYERIYAEGVDDYSGVAYTQRREEIVRCRDCKHYEDGKNAYGVPRQCLAFGHMLDYGSGFCAWGERRDA